MGANEHKYFWEWRSCSGCSHCPIYFIGVLPLNIWFCCESSLSCWKTYALCLGRSPSSVVDSAQHWFGTAAVETLVKICFFFFFFYVLNLHWRVWTVCVMAYSDLLSPFFRLWKEFFRTGLLIEQKWNIGWCLTLVTGRKKVRWQWDECDTWKTNDNSIPLSLRQHLGILLITQRTITLIRRRFRRAPPCPVVLFVNYPLVALLLLPSRYCRCSWRYTWYFFSSILVVCCRP